MTKEELKKESEEKGFEYIPKSKSNELARFSRKGYTDGYFDGAEPREKRIEELKQQIEKLFDFVIERTEECDVCPLSETCSNSEGVCPYRNKRINLKEWILRHIEVSTVQTETKQFLEYDKMPNCLGTQTTSGN